MPRQISLEGLSSLFSQETDHVWVPVVCIRGLTSYDYLVSNSEDIWMPFDIGKHPAATKVPIKYSACSFSLKLAVDDEDTIPHVSMVIDNVGSVGQSIITAMRNMEDPPDVLVGVVRGKQVGITWSWVIELGPTRYDLLGVTVTPEVVEANLGYHTDFLNEPATTGRFIPSVAVGLFI